MSDANVPGKVFAGSATGAAMAAMLLCLLAFAVPAGAIDSSATLGAGGLILTRTETVALEFEDLYVSLFWLAPLVGGALGGIVYRWLGTSDKS